MAEKEEQSGRKILYTAKMHHNEKTVKRMSHMMFNNFIYTRRRITLLVGLAFLCAGANVVRVREGWGVVLLLLGIFTLYLVDLVPRKVAKQAMKNFAGNYPNIHAFVTDTGMFTQLASDEAEFGSLVKLIEDRKYVYIYVNQVTAFMLEKATVDGEGGLDGFKRFISEKSGLPWDKPKFL